MSGLFRTPCIYKDSRDETDQGGTTNDKEIIVDSILEHNKDDNLVMTTKDDMTSTQRNERNENIDKTTHPTPKPKPKKQVRIAEENNTYIDMGDIPRKVTVLKDSKEEAAFATSRKAELEGLTKDGTFEPIHESKVPTTVRIFGSRFVDELKKVGCMLKKKSRLVAQNYTDDEATAIPTKAPTVQRISQRVALCIAASMSSMNMYTRDITQAYIQSHTQLERDVYIRAPKEMELPPGYIIKVVKPLYGIPESGLHWYLTYLTHHLDTLRMTRTRSDPCILIRRTKDGALDGLILLQVDDSLGLGSDTFMQEEEQASKAFRCKPRTPISEEETGFNGISIKSKTETQTSNTETMRGYTITQCDKIRKLDDKIEGEKQFISQRALAQYIGVNVRPDICAPVQLITPGNAPPSNNDYKSLMKTIKFLKATTSQGLNYVPIDLQTAHLVLMTDASFANAEGKKSQLGYVIAMVDDKGRCNILHYGSNKCKRIARSVMAAEVIALVLGYDVAFVVKDLVEEILGREVKLEVMIDSRTVFNVIAKDGQTAEKRLQIDVLALRQSYDAGELEQFSWIPGSVNPADALTKPVISLKSPLYMMMSTNVFDIDPKGWALTMSHEKKVGGVSNMTV